VTTHSCIPNESERGNHRWSDHSPASLSSSNADGFTVQQKSTFVGQSAGTVVSPSPSIIQVVFMSLKAPPHSRPPRGRSRCWSLATVLGANIWQPESICGHTCSCHGRTHCPSRQPARTSVGIAWSTHLSEVCEGMSRGMRYQLGIS
jgi:hypothetical protein